jgi:hypothetical protein
MKKHVKNRAGGFRSCMPVQIWVSLIAAWAILVSPMTGQSATMVCTPDTSHVNFSDIFTVDITVDATTEGLHCYNITVVFDTALITLLNVEEGALIDDSGQPSFFFWDSTGGALNIGDCLLGYGLHVNGPGSVARLTLEAKMRSGISSLLIEVEDFSDTALVKIPVSADPGTIIVGTPSCCGLYASGYTGNTDCDTSGKRNLADITRLIDRVYISKQPLCCEENGNVDGDVDGKLNLADITRLIDHVYLSKQVTSICQ